MQTLEESGLEDYEERAANITIQECQSNIENIEEVATIEIGAETFRRSFHNHLCLSLCKIS